MLWGPKPPLWGCSARGREKFRKHSHNSCCTSFSWPLHLDLGRGKKGRNETSALIPKHWTQSLQVPWLGIEPRTQWGERWTLTTRPPGLGLHSAASWWWVFCSTLLHPFQPSASFLKRALSVLLFSAVRLVGNQKHTQNDAFSHTSTTAHPLFLTARSSFPAVWPSHKCHTSLIGNPCLLGLIGLACRNAAQELIDLSANSKALHRSTPALVAASPWHAPLPVPGYSAPLLAAQLPPPQCAYPIPTLIWNDQLSATAFMCDSHCQFRRGETNLLSPAASFHLTGYSYAIRVES